MCVCRDSASSAAAPGVPPPRGSRSRGGPRSTGSSPTSPWCARRVTRRAPCAGCRPPALLHELHEHVLALARHTGREVHQAVRVRADEVERPLHQPAAPRASVHRPPPVARHPREARPACRPASAAACSSAGPEISWSRGMKRRPTPRAAAPSPRASAQRLRALSSFGRGRAASPPRAAHAELVPLDLEGHQGRDQVVDVRGARDEHGMRAVAGVEPASPPRGRVHLLPSVDRDAVVARTPRAPDQGSRAARGRPRGRACRRIA